MQKKWSNMASAAISIIVWLIFVWLHTFTFLTCFEDHAGIYSYLGAAVIAMIATIFYWFILKEYLALFDDEEEDEDTADLQCDESNNDNNEAARWSTLHKSMMAVGGLVLLYLLIFALEIWTDITVFTDNQYVNIGTFYVNKKFMFDPVLFIIFPLWVQVIFRGMMEHEFRWKSIVSGCIQILLLSAMSFLLFMALPNIWLIVLAIMESITVIAGSIKYVWKKVKKKGNIIALIGLYIIFWCALLSLFHYSGQTMTQYTYGNDWEVYQKNVAELLSGASAFGSSFTLAQNERVLEFLSNRENYLFTSLYFGGRVSAGVVIVLVVLFLMASKRLLGKHARYNRNYLVYYAAWWSLALKVIIGLLYSFGILALPISLPFAGEIGIYMDTIALGLLICAAIEGSFINESLYEECRIRDLFESDEVELIEIGSDDVFGFFKLVQIQSGDKILECIVEECSEYNVMVLESIIKNENWLLILEKNGEAGNWIDVDDEEVRKEIYGKYITRNGPDCMEVIEK